MYWIYVNWSNTVKISVSYIKISTNCCFILFYFFFCLIAIKQYCLILPGFGPLTHQYTLHAQLHKFLAILFYNKSYLNIRIYYIEVHLLNYYKLHFLYSLQVFIFKQIYVIIHCQNVTLIFISQFDLRSTVVPLWMGRNRYVRSLNTNSPTFCIL